MKLWLASHPNYYSKKNEMNNYSKMNKLFFRKNHSYYFCIFF